jgi:thiol-disulfide isomerase/thioredoxin
MLESYRCPPRRNAIDLTKFAPLLTLLMALAPPGLAGELRKLAVPQPAPALELPDTQGAPHNLAAWQGQVVLLNFWASWCAPCIEEMPGLQRLAAQMRGRPFAVVAVNVGDLRRRAKHFAAQLKLDFPMLLDSDGATFNAWGGKGLPTSVLIDRGGSLRYLGLGPLEWDGAEAVAAVEALLGEPVP